MAYTVKYKNPSYPEGQPLHLVNIGLVENGGSVKLSEEAEVAFIARTGQSVKDYFANRPMIEVSGTSELNKKQKEEGGEK